MADIEKRYKRALRIADFLMEGGYLIQDAAKEFRISRDTVRKDLQFLATHGYDKELERNRIMYIKATTAAYNENRRRKCQKKKG